MLILALDEVFDTGLSNIFHILSVTNDFARSVHAFSTCFEVTIIGIVACRRLKQNFAFPFQELRVECQYIFEKRAATVWI